MMFVCEEKQRQLKLISFVFRPCFLALGKKLNFYQLLGAEMLICGVIWSLYWNIDNSNLIVFSIILISVADDTTSFIVLAGIVSRRAFEAHHVQEGLNSKKWKIYKNQ